MRTILLIALLASSSLALANQLPTVKAGTPVGKQLGMDKAPSAHQSKTDQVLRYYGPPRELSPSELRRQKEIAERLKSNSESRTKSSGVQAESSKKQSILKPRSKAARNSWGSRYGSMKAKGGTKRPTVD